MQAGTDILNAVSESELAREIFGTSDRLRELFKGQDLNLLEFGAVSVPVQHCLDVGVQIQEYLESAGHRNASLFGSNAELGLLLALLHHLPAASLQYFETTAQSDFAQGFWQILRAYDRLRTNYFARLLKRSGDSSKVKRIELGEPSEDDRNDASLINALAIESFGDRRDLLLNFQLLLFFDLESIIRVTSRDLADPQLRRYAERLSRFILHVLPEVIGTYKFGERGGRLRDFAFQQLEPRLYERTRKLISEHQPSKQRCALIRELLCTIQGRIQLRVSISEREKSVFSAFKKAAEYRTDVSNLWDLYGFRVIVDSTSSAPCYEILSIVQSAFPRWGEAKGFADYISLPKDNNYQSIHLVLGESVAEGLVEVQIRTASMNYVAEFGSASHQAYKRQDSPNALLDETVLVRNGRRIIETHLSSHHLSLNDFVEHLGVSLDHVPLAHYFEKIARGEYDARGVAAIIAERKRSDAT